MPIRPTADTAVATTPEHLRDLVQAAIEQHGPHCDLNTIDVSRIDDFDFVFEDSPFNGDLSRWNTSRVVCMRQMFEWSPFNGDISQWNTSSVLDAQIMFHSSGFARDISAWNLSPQAKTLFMFAKNPKGRAAQTPTEWVVRAFLTDLIKDGYTCDPSLSLGQAMSEYHRLSAALGFDPNDMPRDVLNLHHALQTREPSYPVDRLLETN